GEADNLLRRLLELVERGGRGSERRLERVDGRLRTGGGRLAGLLDPGGGVLRVRRPRFFGERRELRLRLRRDLVQAARVGGGGFDSRLGVLGAQRHQVLHILDRGGGRRAFDALREDDLRGVHVEVDELLGVFHGERGEL